VVWEVHRPSYKGDDPDLPKLTRHLSKSAKQRVAIGFLENAYTTAEKSDDGPDSLLLDEAGRLAEEAPSPSLIPALAKVDPSRPRVTGTQEDTLGMLMRVARALKHPKARAIINGWLEKGVPAPEEDLKKWKASR